MVVTDDRKKKDRENAINLRKKRKELKTEGKNICFGELCDVFNGKIHSLDMFETSAMCKKCYKRKQYRQELKKEGKNICFGILCNGVIHDLCMFHKYHKTICKKCFKETGKNYRERGGNTRKIVIDHKTGKSCLHCGENDIRLLELDHIDRNNKIRPVSECSSITSVIEEIKKTQILCIECHRTKTYKEFGFNDPTNVLEKYLYTDEETIIKTESKKCTGPVCKGVLRDISMFNVIKSGKKISQCKKCRSYKHSIDRIKRTNYVIDIKIKIKNCAICNKEVTKDNHFTFDFDHLRDKKSPVSKLIYASKHKLDEEIKKCQLLCCKCHKIKTAEERNYRYTFTFTNVEIK
jgi:hypothetical protein